MTVLGIVQSKPASQSPPRTRIRHNTDQFGFDCFYLCHPRRAALIVLLAYLFLAVLYALRTPAWQAPDEPAHYNYVAHIATTGTLPILTSGDYNQEQLERLLGAKFAPKLSTGALNYESYQPPLYYLVATPVFWLTDGNVLALRLFNVGLGAAGLLLIYLCLESVFKLKTLITVGATAFAGLLPMHVAVAASVTNDVLAEVLVLAAMLALLRWMRGQLSRSGPNRVERSYRELVVIGLLLGLGMVTKIYAYLLLPLAVAAIMFITMRMPSNASPTTAAETGGALSALVRATRVALITAIPAILLALPMWIRNVRLYGLWDLLGLTWHDQVVLGQPRTADWIAENGWPAYMEHALGFTFQSFWGVFGWMGVFMDQRIYTALLVFSGVLFLGLLWAVVRMISGPPDTDMNRLQVAVLLYFSAMILVVMAGYIAYNVKFVQHQGRYFFWGLLPLSTIVALGWREVMHPLQGFVTGLLAGVLGVSLALAGYLNAGLDKWTVLTVSMIALLLLLQPLLLAPTSAVNMKRVPIKLRPFFQHNAAARISYGLRTLAWAIPFVLLFMLNLSIALMLIPQQLGA